jgi:hypothetical protein
MRSPVKVRSNIGPLKYNDCSHALSNRNRCTLKALPELAALPAAPGILAIGG